MGEKISFSSLFSVHNIHSRHSVQLVDPVSGRSTDSVTGIYLSIQRSLKYKSTRSLRSPVLLEGSVITIKGLKTSKLLSPKEFAFSYRFGCILKLQNTS